MLRLLAYTVLAAVLYYAGTTAVSWRRNVKKAQQSGLPYILVPVFFLHPLWLAGHVFLMPLFTRLPRSWMTWIEYCIPDFGYSHRMDAFERVGADTFLTVAPSGLVMYTCDAEVINQVVARRNDFPKPSPIYRALKIYGGNVVSAEGNVWRQHRKAVSPPFTEKNNHLVWQETIDQSLAMLTSWVGRDGEGNKTIDRVADDTMRLSLHVISRAGFGRKLEWPEDDTDVQVDKDYVDPSKIQNDMAGADEGHSMSYAYAIHCLLDNILFQLLFPRWLLRYVPLKAFKKADEAYSEWGNYMREAVEKKRTDLDVGKEVKEESMDILAGLVKSQTKADKQAHLEDSEILGNMFVLILAGHETAANSIHFSMLYLALHRQSQLRLQKDVDDIFSGKPPSEWDYDRDLPQLFGSMVGAVLNEELRLVSPVVAIPKSTWGAPDAPLTIDGKTITVPAETYIGLVVAASHRNPKLWPISPPTYPGGKPVHPRSNLDNDLEEFRPERWIVTEEESRANKDASQEKKENMAARAGGDLNIDETSDTSERLYKPPKGAYAPFSDGHRSCIGRRFAQVEILVALAIIFQNYSVELAVDSYASDEEVAEMDDNAKADVWQKAAEDVREKMLNNMAAVITLQMRKGTVPIRLVPRGQERFPPDVDQIWKDNHPDKCTTKGRPDWRPWDGKQMYHGA
jgi:cytochrome P450